MLGVALDNNGKLPLLPAGSLQKYCRDAKRCDMFSPLLFAPNTAVALLA